MIQPKETTIDGCKVSTTKHPPMRGLQLKARLFKIALPSIGALVASGMKSLTEMMKVEFENPEALAKIAPAFEKLAEAINPDDLPALLCELLTNTSIVVPGANGQPVRIELGTLDGFNIAFDDNRDSLIWRVAVFAAGVNFADFLGGKASAPNSPQIPAP